MDMTVLLKNNEIAKMVPKAEQIPSFLKELEFSFFAYWNLNKVIAPKTRMLANEM
jgi:hypothetical protein